MSDGMFSRDILLKMNIVFSKSRYVSRYVSAACYAILKVSNIFNNHFVNVTQPSNIPD